MNTAERNRHLRELANEIAAQVAPVIGLRRAPKCIRITRRRGYGDAYEFSIPFWCSKNTDYFVYYVAHEVCHAVALDHGPVFRRAEQQALRHFGLAIRYARGGAGPYASAILDANTGAERVIAATIGARARD